MNIKKSLKDVIVLVAICAVFALALAYVNSITAPEIEKGRLLRANEAYIEVMPGAEGFEDFDISNFDLPSSVVKVKKEISGKGYAVELSVAGYKPGMVIVVGVSTEGVVTGAKCTESSETNGVEKSYGSKFVGLTSDAIDGVDLVGGSTMTSSAYRNAIKDAINTATIVGGGRTEEQKYNDAIIEALPAGNGEFTKVTLLAATPGIDAIYEATNGEGYVCVIGTDSKGTFIGVDKDGNVVGDHTEEHKALAQAAIESVKANATVDVDLTPYLDNEIIKNYVNYVKKTGTGNYVIEIKTAGENYTAETPIVLMIVIGADGRIVNIQTVSHAETDSLGGIQLQDGKFNAGFIGKDQTEAGNVDTVAGVTMTTRAFKNAVNNAFNVVALLQGGDVDFRTEEEKFADALDAALPAGEGKFTKYFRVEIIEGVDSIYVADNGAGYVCVIGTDSTGTFIGVGSDGVAVGEVSAEHKTLAESVISIVKATTLTDIDIEAYKNSEDKEVKRVFRMINYIKKTASGNYIIEIQCDGHGKKGDPSHEHASGERYVIKVCISADGVIIDSQTVKHSETSNWGGPQLEDGAYNSNFIGKDEAGAGAVDTVAGTTNTTSGYKEAILRCFTAIYTIEGGAANE